MEIVNLILNRLIAQGYQAYIVGGAVRDILSGFTPKEIHIATSATPEQIRPLFTDFSISEVGKASGVLVIDKDGESLEIATFRADRPGHISFGKTIEEYLAGRDFTCNAIAMDVNEQIIDPFNGRQDIQRKELRFVGDPFTRITEDCLRILRVYRFMSQLGFSIHSITYKAICQATRDPKHALLGVSQQQITSEFQKILEGRNGFNTIRLMAEDGMLFLVMPELYPLVSPHHSPHHLETMEPWGNTIFAHTMLVLKHVCEHEQEGIDADTRLVTRLAALCHDIAKPICRLNKGDHDSYHGHDLQGGKVTKKVLNRMKFPKVISNRVVNIVSKHMKIFDIIESGNVAKIRRFFSQPDIDNLIALVRADKTVSGGEKAVSPLNDCVRKYRG